MMKSFAITTMAVVMLLSSGSAAADVVKVNVGPTLNPFFLRLVCNRIAGERGGRLVNTERAGPNKNGTCYIDVPKRSGIVMTPGTVRQPVQNQPVRNQPVQQQTDPDVTGRLMMVNVGKLWSQPHADQRCKRIARKNDAVWTGLWKRQDSRGEAQCQLRKKPEFKIQAIHTGRIWSDSHAKYRCPRVAQEAGGKWNGQWKRNPKDSAKAICMVKVKNVRKVVKPFATSKIWSEAHAKQHCAKLAKQNKGEWTGKWRNADTGSGSICMIKVLETQLVTQQNQQQNQNTQVTNNTVQTQQTAVVTQNSNVRNVQAGDIWDQGHAERKCPVVARNAKGSWTGRWSKTGPGNKSVCVVRFGGGIVAQATKPTTSNTKPTQTTNTRTRNVAAGPIWDDKQAAQKCPVVAANNKAKWTGNWTKTGPGHTSVCEISVNVPGQATQSQSQSAVQVQVLQSTIREVPAGGIWDQAHANRKCPVVAFNYKGRWTGKWRKINAKNEAVCEIDTRK